MELIINSILKWWEENKDNAISNGEDEYNLYDEEPEFVRLAKVYALHLKSAKSYEDGFYDGLKIGLQVAKDVCKREGYEFSFPDPESIRISKDEDRHKGEEVKE